MTMTDNSHKDPLSYWQSRAIQTEQDRDQWKAQAEAEAIVCGSYRDERDELLPIAQCLWDALQEVTEQLEEESEELRCLDNIVCDGARRTLLMKPQQSVDKIKEQGVREFIDHMGVDWPCQYRDDALEYAAQLRNGEVRG